MTSYESEDDVVISGISGRYPNSNNLNEFWENLLSGEPLFTRDTRWPATLNLPPLAGQIKCLENFDYEFFRIPVKHAHVMDPQVRIMHETTYEAIWDAGYDPAEFVGERTGFFIGACYNDTSYAKLQDHAKIEINGYPFSSTVPFFFDFRGQSLQVDTACAASFSAFHQAIDSLRRGQHDRVIVSGLAVHLRPQVPAGFCNLRMLSPNGQCRSLDANADGYCRSEAVVSMLLQRRNDARRCYATVLHTATNCDGNKTEGITFPGRDLQLKLMQRTFKEAGIDPERDLDYIEAHMTGTPVGDPVESSAILEALRPNSKRPLKFGCLKSNMGHTEGASGLCAISKACLIFQKRQIPPNIGFTTPNPNIEGLHNGLIEPIVKPEPFDSDLIAVNAFGFGGVNVHGILKSPSKKATSEDYDLFKSEDGLAPEWWNEITQTSILSSNKSKASKAQTLNKSSYLAFNYKGRQIRLEELPNFPTPRLINLVGRTNTGVIDTLKYLKENRSQVNIDLLQMIDKLSKIRLESGMTVRGYTVWNPDESIIEPKTLTTVQTSPLCLLFSGLGCQWSGMARDALRLRPFAESFIRSSEFMNQRFNLNLFTFVTDSEEEKMFEKDPVPTLVTITAIQIAFVDLLRYLGITDFLILGHSVGEYVSMYASGMSSATRTLHAVYITAKHCLEKLPSDGMMVSVGLPESSFINEFTLPPNVEICCINSSENVTIGGLCVDVRPFIDKLSQQNIFVREVRCFNQVYHHSWIQPLHDDIQKKLKEEAFENDSLRVWPQNWISSSCTLEEQRPGSLFCIAEFLANSVTRKVQYKSAVNRLPKGVCCVEIGPHAQLLPLIKQELGLDCRVVAIQKNDAKDNLVQLLQGIGELFQNGQQPEIIKFYNKNPKWPVSRETISLSPFLKWNYPEKMFLYRYPEYFNTSRLSKKVTIDLDNPKYQYLQGHSVDGRILLPATGYLNIVWECYLQHIERLDNEYDIPIEFTNVSLRRAVIIPKGSSVDLTVIILEESHKFCVIESDQICCDGSFSKISSGLLEIDPIKLTNYVAEEDQSDSKNENCDILKMEDIYKEMRVRGYDHHSSFQCLLEAQSDGRRSKVEYNAGGWVPFADSLLQTMMVAMPVRELFLPTYIEKLRCESTTLKHRLDFLRKNEQPCHFDVYFDPMSNICATTGIMIKGLQVSSAARRSNSQMVQVQKYVHTPYLDMLKLNDQQNRELNSYIQHVLTLSKAAIGGKQSVEEAGLDRTKLKETYGSDEKYSLIQLLLDYFEQKFNDGKTDSKEKNLNESAEKKEDQKKF